jgi:uncharacterized protein (UPF0332 family)
VTPETEQFLDKERRLIDEAEATAGLGLSDAAGRAAYIAGFHVAQALLSEKTGRTAKTHRGVQTEFLRLTKDSNLQPDLRAFLSHAYQLKAIADYETGENSRVSTEQATRAVATAKRFLAYFERALGGDNPDL